MKTIMLLMGLILVGCAGEVSFEPAPVEDCDCDEVELSDECSAECVEVEPVTNEGASCKVETDCTPGLWCVITPETGPTEGICTVES
jgi:hypothetical protein